jgi:putative transposase
MDQAECLDRVVVLSAAGLRRVLTEHRVLLEIPKYLSLNKDAPISRAAVPPTNGDIAAIPQVGGLHHRYERRAA